MLTQYFNVFNKFNNFTYSDYRCNKYFTTILNIIYMNWLRENSLGKLFNKITSFFLNFHT